MLRDVSPEKHFLGVEYIDRESIFLGVSMATDRVGRLEVLISIYQKSYAFEDLRKDKKLVNSENYSFYDSDKNFGL